MLLADIKSAKEIDYNSTNKYMVPSLLLMEDAGMRVADEAISTGASSFAVIIGKGNNGGDGSVVARHLFCNHKEVYIIIADCRDEISGDAKTMLDTAVSIGVKVINTFDEEAKSIISSSEVIIDAMLGIGCRSAPRGIIANIIDYINAQNKYVIAIDVPSGVNADNGNVCKSAVVCKKTVTFNIGRLGLMLYPAKQYAGEVIIKNISFAPDAVKNSKIKIGIAEYKSNFVIPPDCHKSSVGKVLVSAGSEGMSGAGFIASTAALKCGSGVVSLCLPSFLNLTAEQRLTEIMTIPVHDNGVTMSCHAADVIVNKSKSYDTLVIGCGLGNNEDIKSIMSKVIRTAECDLVIDADGLNCIDKNDFEYKKRNVVITPHIGEMARLTGMSIDEIKSDIVRAALGFASEYQVAVVLKCATTVVAFPNGNAYVNPYGNSGMATAGSGDALAGIIGAEIAMSDNFETAVVNGVCLHSMAGDYAKKLLGKRYMSAMDIVDCLKYVIIEED